MAGQPSAGSTVQLAVRLVAGRVPVPPQLLAGLAAPAVDVPAFGARLGVGAVAAVDLLHWAEPGTVGRYGLRPGSALGGWLSTIVHGGAPAVSSTPPGRGAAVAGVFAVQTVPLHAAPCDPIPPPADAGYGPPPYVSIMSEEPIGYVYVRVADQVEAEIRSGRLPRGARLPNERDMGAEYGVAPGTA